MNNMMKKLPLLLTAAMMCAGLGVHWAANAIIVQTTDCTYKLIGGAPWAPQYKTERYSGHIQCPSTSHEAIGGYTLVGTRYNG